MINSKNIVTRKDLPKDLLCLDINGAYLLPSLDIVIQIDSEHSLDIIKKSFMRDRLIAVLMQKDKEIISDIGCLGKIRTFVEDDDNQIVVGVRGICRFNYENIYLDKDNIKNIVPIWDRYLDELDIKKIKINDRFKFQSLLDSYYKYVSNFEQLDFKKYAKITDQELFNLAIELLNIDRSLRLKLLKSHNFDAMIDIITKELELKLAEIEASSESKH